MENLKSAYTAAGNLQKKFTVNSDLLINLSALHPIVPGHSKTYSCLHKLLPVYCWSLPVFQQYTAEISASEIDKEGVRISWRKVHVNVLKKLLLKFISVFPTGSHEFVMTD